MYKELIKKEKYNIEDLLKIMSMLRSENGCPWDRVQTHKTIRNNFIEETYEVIEAIDLEDNELLKEELGDVLLQVVFHTQMEDEKDRFDFNDVVTELCKKLIVRHPHIFSDVKVNGVDDVLSNWADIKKKTKGQTTATETLESVSKALPSLMRSEKVQGRAGKVGFDYPNIETALGDLESEIEELREAIENNNDDNFEEEIGDVLFSAVNVARLKGKNPEEMLSKSCDKFISRFKEVERLALERKIDIKSANIEDLNRLWCEAKVKSFKGI